MRIEELHQDCECLLFRRRPSTMDGCRGLSGCQPHPTPARMQYSLPKLHPIVKLSVVMQEACDVKYLVTCVLALEVHVVLR